MWLPRAKSFAGTLRHLPCRAPCGVQLQTTGLLPQLRRPAHGRERGAAVNRYAPFWIRSQDILSACPWMSCSYDVPHCYSLTDWLIYEFPNGVIEGLTFYNPVVGHGRYELKACVDAECLQHLYVFSRQ